MELGQLADYFGAMVKGIPLLLIVAGVVEYIKKAGLTGNKLLFASMGVGLVFGGGWVITQERPPLGDAWTIYVYWFGVMVYGVGLGLVASGLFDMIRGILKPKTVVTYTVSGNPDDSNSVTVVETPNDPLP